MIQLGLIVLYAASLSWTLSAARSKLDAVAAFAPGVPFALAYLFTPPQLFLVAIVAMFGCAGVTLWIGGRFRDRAMKAAYAEADAFLAAQPCPARDDH